MKLQQRKLIYWEKQGIDQLCGAHSINSLLQGPFYNQVELSQIALDLDKKQKNLMMSQGITQHFLKYMAQDSGNVAMDGNFSVQVIQQALKRLHLAMYSIEKINQKQHLTKRIGFICNSAAHWFALRKVDGIWYNLNSCNKRLPQIISQFYLAAFFDSVKYQGYTIFSVQGIFPQSSKNKWQHYNDYQNWYPPQRILKYHQKCIKKINFRPNISGASSGGRRDKEMEKAIAQSLGKKYSQISSGQDSDWQKQNKQVKLLPKKTKKLEQQPIINYQKFFFNVQETEISKIYKFSLQQKFKQQLKKGIEVCFVHNTGRKQRKTFQGHGTIQQLYDYIWCSKERNQQFYLINAAGKQKLLDVTIPLKAIVNQNGYIQVFVTYN